MRTCLSFIRHLIEAKCWANFQWCHDFFMVALTSSLDKLVNATIKRLVNPAAVTWDLASIWSGWIEVKRTVAQKYHNMGILFFCQRANLLVFALAGHYFCPPHFWRDLFLHYWPQTDCLTKEMETHFRFGDKWTWKRKCVSVSSSLETGNGNGNAFPFPANNRPTVICLFQVCIGPQFMVHVFKVATTSNGTIIYSIGASQKPKIDLKN